jgi:signal transduction histidine kinase
MSSQQPRTLDPAEQLARIMETLHVVPWEWDPAADMSTVPEGATPLAGPGTETLGGFLDAIHVEDRPIVVAAMERALTSDAPQRVRFRRRKEPDHWIEATGRRVIDADGHVRLAGMSVDVTERVVLEERVAHLRKLSAVGRLAAGVAHDFSNVLGSVRASIDQVLAHASVDADVRADIAQIAVAADRGEWLTRQLVALARGMPASTHAVDVAAVVDQSIPALRRVLGEHVRVVKRLHACGNVLGHPTQLHQLLLNLAANAHDAMPEGGTFTLEVTRCKAGVRVSVSDTGHGIPADIRGRIFDPFFTTKPAGKSAGLGLSIVDGIVEALDGTISVTSTFGEGTTFHIDLPLAPDWADQTRSGPVA